MIQEIPHLRFTTHEVDKDGVFKFTTDSEGPIVLHAVAIDHPSSEHVIDAGTTGTVTIDFMLPIAQDVKVSVVDAAGNAVEGAELRVRYHEPEKPMRRVSFESAERTDEDGQIPLPDVGIQVPFIVDVLAPNYPPISSKLTKLEFGETQMEDIMLGDPGAIIVVELLDKAGNAVPDTWVTLLADPAGLPEQARGSWLHSRAFRQRLTTSSQGEARFTGVPPGRVIVRVKTETGSVQRRGIGSSNEELRINLTVP